MSSTTIMGLVLNKSAEDLYEYKNSWGFSVPVWEALIKTYLPGSNWYEDGVLKKLRKAPLAPYERVLLYMSYDGGYIRCGDLGRAADDIDAFLKKHKFPLENANHWPRIARAFREYSVALTTGVPLDPNYDALGFYPTSVGENFWYGERCCDCDCEHCGGDKSVIAWDKAWDIYQSRDMEEKE